MIEAFLGTLAGLIIFCGLVFLLVWEVLAPRNLSFTFVREAKAKIIVKGGKFVGVLIQWKGHTLDKEYNVISEDATHKESEHPFGGLRWVGPWPLYDILHYDFEWTGVDQQGEIARHPKERLDYVLLMEDLYYLKVEKAEDAVLLPLGIGAVLTIRVVNPYKALYRIENWLETVFNRIKPLIVDIVRTKEYAVWTPLSLQAEVLLKVKPLFIEIEENYGVLVSTLEIRDIEPPKEWVDATLKKFNAERNREATIIDADAQKQKISIEATGEAERIRKLYNMLSNYGDSGKFFRAMEATEKSQMSASLMVQAVPGLQDILKGVLGKSPEAATPEDIKLIREMLEKLSKEK